MHRKFRWIALAISIAAAFSAAAQDAEVPEPVRQLVEKFNDDVIPFNDKPVILGNENAPVTGVFVFGLSENTSWMVNRAFSSIKKHIKSGQLKLVVIEMPLTWHDMQAFAGFRCVAPEKHWTVLEDAVSDPRYAGRMKNDSLINAPEHIWSMMRGNGVNREQAERCMRNSAIVGHIEAQRRVVKETWGTEVAPSFIIGDKVITDPTNDTAIIAAIESALKGNAQ